MLFTTIQNNSLGPKYQSRVFSLKTPEEHLSNNFKRARRNNPEDQVTITLHQQYNNLIMKNYL